MVIGGQKESELNVNGKIKTKGSFPNPNSEISAKLIFTKKMNTELSADDYHCVGASWTAFYNVDEAGNETDLHLSQDLN